MLQCHFSQTAVGTQAGSQCHPINSGAPVHDGPGGDKINIVDALAILQLHFGALPEFD